MAWPTYQHNRDTGSYLRDEIKVGNKSTLENDGDVGSVEELDRVRTILATITCTLDGKIDSEPLQTPHVGVNCPHYKASLT